jgi:dihydrolipoamide dehydrogenase
VLARAARLVRDAEQFATYGLVGERPTIDFGRLLGRTQQVVDQIHEKKQLEQHLQRAGVTTHQGEARFTDSHTIILSDGSHVRGETFVIAAGGRSRRLPFPGAELALTHSDVWTLPRQPRSLAIIGGAATGCQMASVFAAFGSNVSLLEMAPRLIPGEDEAISDALGRLLRSRGITTLTGISGVEKLEQTDNGLRLHYTDEDEARALDVDAVVMAVGWPGNVDNLDLAAANVHTERSYVVVNDALQTSVPHIYAAGDITGRMMLVQSATYEARIAAENAIGGTQMMAHHHIVPHGGFTDPEYGSVGLTEKQARAEHDVSVAVVPYADLDRAIIDGHPEGFCKLVVSRSTREILGAHVIGEQAVEVVQMVAAGMMAGTRVEHLAQLELAYPTYTAIVGLAARQIVRELGVVPLAPAWRALLHPRASEWERSQSNPV